MKRKYELKKRAEAQGETRQRIVEAAIELHSTKGPGRTTISDVAQVAGVQRATVYSHFPSERELGMACSGLYQDRNPAPDPEEWVELEGEERLRRGLREMYAFFEHNQAMIGCVMSDLQWHELTREMFELRFGERLERIGAVLAAALPNRRKGAQAMLGMALNFFTWQQLSQSGLSSSAAADAMVRAILAQ